MAVNTQEKESLISCGLDLNNIANINEMKAVINDRGLDKASEIILDLKDRLNRLTTYINSLKDSSLLVEKNNRLLKSIRNIKHYVQEEEESILYYDKIYSL